MQRCCDRVSIRAYRTISADAANLLNSTPPIDLLLTARSIQWLHRHNLPITYWGIFPETLVNGTPAEWRRAIADEWSRRWAASVAAPWTHQLFPSLEHRLTTPLVLNFHVTQALSGHGTFGTYLYKYKRRESAACVCGFPEQSPEHVFMTCPEFAANRPTTWTKLTEEHLRYLDQTVLELRRLENPEQYLRPMNPSTAVVT